MTRVQQVLSQVTAEDPLPEDASLLQLLLGGPRLHEGAEEGDQLAVLLRHCGGTEGIRGETLQRGFLPLPHSQ